MIHYLKLSYRKRSHYISWNILFLWGFGLWIALCTSNMYHPDVLTQEENWNSVNAYNIVTKAETVESTLHVTSTYYTLSNIVLMLKAMLHYVHVFALVSFIVLSLYVHQHLRKKTKLWNNIMHDSYSILKTFLKSPERHCTLDRKVTDKHDHTLLQAELTANYEMSAEHSQTEDRYSLEKSKNKNVLEMNTHTVQIEITFDSHTLLLLNNYELYSYFIDRQLRDTCYFSRNYSMLQNLQCIEDERRCLSNYQRHTDNRFNKRIITSSPEFKKFLANLNKSQFLYPCMLEVSTSYVMNLIFLAIVLTILYIRTILTEIDEC